MLTHDVKFDIKDDPILQNSIQEPSKSSKYDCVLNSLLIMPGRSVVLDSVGLLDPRRINPHPRQIYNYLD